MLTYLPTNLHTYTYINTCIHTGNDETDNFGFHTDAVWWRKAMAARVMKTNLKRLAKGRASAKRSGASIGGYHVFARQVANQDHPKFPLGKMRELAARWQQLDGGAKRKRATSQRVLWSLFVRESLAAVCFVARTHTVDLKVKPSRRSLSRARNECARANYGRRWWSAGRPASRRGATPVGGCCCRVRLLGSLGTRTGRFARTLSWIGYASMAGGTGSRRGRVSKPTIPRNPPGNKGASELSLQMIARGGEGASMLASKESVALCCY